MYGHKGQSAGFLDGCLRSAQAAAAIQAAFSAQYGKLLLLQLVALPTIRIFSLLHFTRSQSTLAR